MITLETLEGAGFTFADEGEVVIDEGVTVSDLVNAGILTEEEIAEAAIGTSLIDIDDFLLVGDQVVDDPALVANEGDFIVPDSDDDGELTISDIPDINVEFKNQASEFVRGQEDPFVYSCSSLKP